MVAGAAIYRDQCSACHGLDGKGVDRLFPAVANSSMARADDPTSRHPHRAARRPQRRRRDSEPTAPGMPSYGRQLDDSQIAAVLTYIRNSWGGAAAPVKADDVATVRRDTALRAD